MNISLDALVTAAAFILGSLGVWVRLNSNLAQFSEKFLEQDRRWAEMREAIARLEKRDDLVIALSTTIDGLSKELDRVRARLDRYHHNKESD